MLKAIKLFLRCSTLNFLIIYIPVESHLCSDFGDIFNVGHFINSLRDEVKIVKSLPSKFDAKVRAGLFSMPPVSWSRETYYLDQVPLTAICCLI